MLLLNNNDLELKIIKIMIIFTFILIIIVVLFYYSISFWSKKKIYDDVNKIPFNKFGIILGTSKYSENGNINLYFKNRIDAAILLFKKKKIKYFIVSGNREPHYNEPKIMEKDLINRGVPNYLIYKDYSGLRTLDSVIRAYIIFGQKKYTVISQKFHNERAIFIADILGLKVIGYNAENPLIYNYKKLYFREALARIKALWDVIYGTKPDSLIKNKKSIYLQ